MKTICTVVLFCALALPAWTLRPLPEKTFELLAPAETMFGRSDSSIPLRSMTLNTTVAEILSPIEAYWLNPNQLFTLDLNAYNRLQLHFNGSRQATAACSFWIDLNRNGSFTDKGEEFVVGSTNGKLQFDFKLPAEATKGITYMRVALRNKHLPLHGLNDFDGQVQDLMVKIQ